MVPSVSFWRPGLGGPRGPRGGAKMDREHTKFSWSVWGGLWGVLRVILVVWDAP